MVESEDIYTEESGTGSEHRDIRGMVRKLSDNDWEIPKGHIPNMRVPGRLFVSESLLGGIEPGVITSYSIHYTKLYELLACITKTSVPLG